MQSDMSSHRIIIYYKGYEAAGAPMYAESISDMSLSWDEYFELLVKEDGIAEDIIVGEGADMYVEEGGKAFDVSVSYSSSNNGSGFVYVKGGILEDVYVAGVLQIFDGGQVVALTVSEHGSSLCFDGSMQGAEVENGGQLTLLGGSATGVAAKNGATIVASGNGSELCNGVYSAGSRITFGGGLVLSGTQVIGTTISILAEVNASAATADFLLIESTASGSAALLSNWSLCKFAKYYVTVDADLPDGYYALAGNAQEFDCEIGVKSSDGNLLCVVAPEQKFCVDETVYGVSLDASTLAFCKAPCAYIQLKGDEGGDILLKAVENSVSVYHDADVSVTGEAWKAGEGTKGAIGGIEYLLSEGSVLVEAVDDGSEAVVFFASPEDTWSYDYMAKNAANGEVVGIAGKNRFADVFVGDVRHSLLVLTESNDAIFADDIVTVSPDGHDDLSRRLSGLQEILGGAGDDVIDMTCMNFPDVSEELALRGGAGDDVIWGGCGDTMLFGDEGDDSLTGNIGADLLCGGAGNDILRGFGGGDIYAFCANWGEDTVILESGDESYRLWFDAEISFDDLLIFYTDSTARIACEDSVITVCNVAENGLDGKLLFGDAGEFGGRTYASLLDSGAFASTTSDWPICVIS